MQRDFHALSRFVVCAFSVWKVDPDNRQSPVDLNWRLSAWQMAQKLSEGWWNVEIAIPLASLDVSPEDLKQPWGLQVARN